MSEGQSDADRIADILEPYVNHRATCALNDSVTATHPRTDFCTCGLDDAVTRVNEILNED